jgi:hypothetical protein
MFASVALGSTSRTGTTTQPPNVGPSLETICQSDALTGASLGQAESPAELFSKQNARRTPQDNKHAEKQITNNFKSAE